LILALAFVTLILDAITISFEVNVMDLGLSDVSTQAALLLTPDLLAIFMSLALLIYSIEASCCCFDGPLDYVDDDDDYDHYHSQHHQDEAEEEEEGEEKEGDQHRDASSSDLNGLDDHTREGKSRRHMHDQARRGKEVAVRQDLGGSIHDRQQGTTQRHYNGTVIPTIAITSASSTLEESSDTPSRRVSTIDTDNHLSTHPSPPPTEEEEAIAAAAVDAEVGATEKPKWKSTRSAWRQRKRSLNLYIFTRVLFSLGLVTLALYWPAGQMKPPMGHLPDIPNTGERFRDYGNGMMMDRRIGHPSPPPPPPPPSFQNNYPSKHSREGDDDGLSDDGIPDGTNRWCAWEAEFGDNQSAVVYCRVNDIRPAITYIWATLIVVELCIAAMAGDFSDTGLYGYRADTGVGEDQDGDMTDSGTGVQEQGYPDGSPDEEMAMGVGVGRVYPAQNPLNTSSHT